jgi:hypothetical protein
MKKIMKLIDENRTLSVGIAIVFFIILFGILLHNGQKGNVLILDQENPELAKISKVLEIEVLKYEKEVFILEAKINEAEKINKNQAKQLELSTDNLETEIIEVVKISKDTVLLSLFDKSKVDQENLIESYDVLLILKDSIILEQENVIKSYVFATNQMSNEIEILHAKNNEMLINEMMSKGKIKNRNKALIAGCAVVATVITTAILIK